MASSGVEVLCAVASFAEGLNQSEYLDRSVGVGVGVDARINAPAHFARIDGAVLNVVVLVPKRREESMPLPSRRLLRQAI